MGEASGFARLDFVYGDDGKMVSTSHTLYSNKLCYVMLCYIMLYLHTYIEYLFFFLH